MFNFYKSFKIVNKIISNDHKPYIISEIGSNFNQDLETAKNGLKNWGFKILTYRVEDA